MGVRILDYPDIGVRLIKNRYLARLMKFCYIDESGTGAEPYAVMAGVLIDAYRMRPTKEDWDGLLVALSDIVAREVKEFHTRDFYAGNSPWRDLSGNQRAAVISAIFDWFVARGHHVVYSAVDRRRLEENFSDHPYYRETGSLWKTLGLHIALALQRANQKHLKNKGNTVLVFDEHKQDAKPYAELLLTPPDWTDTYYRRDPRKQAPLDQIVDVPHFVDSSHVGMIQLADCISYFLRRHIEICEGVVPPRYEGEDEVVSRWATSVFDRCIQRSAIYPKKGRCDAAEFFFQLAPESARV